jgi:transcriptional regulator with XRE-family HTH domain
MPSPRTPTQAGRTPDEGHVFAEQLVPMNLRRLRRERDLRQVDVAERMRTLGHETWSFTLVSQVEKGSRDVRLREVFGLALALDCTPADLLTLGDNGLDLEDAAVISGPVADDWIRGFVGISVFWRDDNSVEAISAPYRLGESTPAIERARVKKMLPPRMKGDER